MDADRAIARIAAARHGVFTSADARAAGFTPEAIRHRRESGRWLAAHRGVFVVAGAPHTWEQDVTAAVLAYGKGAAASTITAAVLWDLIEGHTGRPIDVTVPSARRTRGRRGVVLHRATLTRTDVRRVKAIPVIAPNRTLIDLAARLSVARLEEALDTAVHRGLTSLRSLDRYISERHLEHQPGMGTLRKVINDRTKGMSQSELERLFFRKLRASDLPLPTRQFPVGDRYIDIAYPEQRLIVELDGLGSRFSAAALRKDRQRQNEVVLALPGWTLLRFTWGDVETDWQYVDETLRSGLN